MLANVEANVCVECPLLFPVSCSGEAEEAARPRWVNEAQGECTVLTKTAGDGAETRRGWVILEVHVPSADGTLVLEP